MSKFRNIKALWLDQKGSSVEDDDLFFQAMDDEDKIEQKLTITHVEDDDLFYQEGGEGGDEQPKGKYDDDVAGFSTGLTEGIVRDRSCTDVLCLIIFWAFLGSMIYLTAFGLKNGQYDKLMAPLDQDNNFCGFDSMAGYPKLVLTKYVSTSPIEILKSGVCVKQCPGSAEAAGGFAWQKGVNCNGGAGPNCDISSVYKTYNNPLDICIPASLDALTPEEKKGAQMMLDYIKNTAAGQILNDMYLSSTSIYISFATALVWSIVYIYVLSLFAETLAWCCVWLIQLGLIGATGVCYIGWEDEKSELNTMRTMAGYYTKMSPVEQVDFDKNNAQQVKIYLGMMIGCGLLSLIFACMVCCGRKSLQTAIDVIDASADYIAHNKRVILVPNMHFLIQIVVVIVWLFGFCAVLSLNEIKPDPIIPQKKDVTFKDKKFFYMALYMVFGFFWLTAFVEYLSRFVVIVGAVTYYFNNHKDNEEEQPADINYGFTCAYWYHPGSIALGSFIIALVRFIKLVFYYLAKQAEKRSGDNAMIKIIAACGMCCLKCIEKFCDYINEAAFCYMAVTGDYFFKAAWNGFLLNLKHGLAFSFANMIAKVFMFIGKFGITVTNCFTLYAIMKFVRGDTEEISSIWGPVFVVGVVTYMAASLFLGLFEEAVMALLTCVCVDMDMNNGEPVYGPATFHDNQKKIQEDQKKTNDME